MKITAAALFMFVVFSTAAFAQWYDTKTGKPVADTEWRKSIDGLGAALLLTAEAEAFHKEWTESPESHMPTAKPVTQVKRGAMVTALLLFSGCGESGGQCAAAVDFKVLNPDGSVYGDVPGNPAWSGPSPKPGLVVLSPAHLQIRIEPKDQLGQYTVLGVMRETSSGKTLRLKQQFRVVE